ncbi:MAG: hypothetical protein AB7U61_14675 [Methylocystis sp.]
MACAAPDGDHSCQEEDTPGSLAANIGKLLRLGEFDVMEAPVDTVDDQ